MENENRAAEASHHPGTPQDPVIPSEQSEPRNLPAGRQVSPADDAMPPAARRDPSASLGVTAKKDTPETSRASAPPPPAARPRAAVFDLGGVVIEVSLVRAMALWAAASGLAPAEIQRRLLADLSNYYRFERSDLGPEAFLAGLAQLMGRPEAPEAFRSGWLAILGGPLPGIDPLLARLKRHVRLVLLTNTNPIHSAEFRRTCAPTLAHFERIFESWQMRCRKPEPACFAQVLEYLALPPEEVLFFDDTAENIAAATRLGVVARLVRGPQDIERELAAVGLGSI
jgi:putative hydrolase of the HAD superfamily